jgi:outer membrane protein assembly factor BamB
MMMKTTPQTLVPAILVACFLLVSPSPPAHAAEDAAARMVRESGIKGGLVVYVGPVEAQAIVALRLSERYLVQALDTDSGRVRRANQKLHAGGQVGPVTTIQWGGGMLPYVDNLVGLLLIRDRKGLTRAEGMRVLAPGGVAYVKSAEGWTRHVKPWPADIDEWTHFLHDPDNNAVAEDTRVGPPHHLQWVAGPRWGRSHDHLASMSAAVSASGRLFYIADEGVVASVAEPARWTLAARDAFNGVLLWKRQVGPWEDHLRPFRSGPAELPRRLVAVGERVYVTLGYGEPVVVLDAATGQTLRAHEGTENTHEVLYHQGKLYLVISEPLTAAEAKESKTTGKVIRRLSDWRDFYHRFVTQYPPKHISCLDAETGELLWQKKDTDTKNILPITLAVSGNRAFFENEKEIVAIDAETGEPLWRAERPIAFHRYAWAGSTLVVKDGVLLSADRSPDVNLDTGGGDKSQLEWLVTANHLLTAGQIMAFRADTGEKLWTAPCHEGFNFPVDVFVAQGKVWSGELAWGKQPGITKVYDLHTGEVVARRPADQECYTLGFGHARCYRNKATTKYVIHGRAGVEFLDMSSNDVVADHWVRGTCQYGILPCNGLIYAPPHSCACYVEAKLEGFNALAPTRRPHDQPSGSEDLENRLERGPAYEALQTSKLQPHGVSDWPTYRRDNQRHGVAGASLSPDLTAKWEETLAGPLTSVVVADGRLFFAQKDRHVVHALEAATGKPLWHYVTGGRVDSPPTIRGDFAYVGSADGSLYCLRCSDGALAWRFRLAPEPQQVVSYDQLESVWPAHGTVLVHGTDTPVAYAAAGRSSFLDGGLFLYRLDARSGEMLSVRRISHRDPESGREPQDTVKGTGMPGALPDVLTTDGSSVFMRHMRFDMEGRPLPQDVDHLYSPAGFLDASWWHRTYWQIGTTMRAGYGGWGQIGNQRISGRILVHAGDRVFGFGRKGYTITGSHEGLNSEYHLFAADIELIRPKPTAEQKRKRRLPPTQVDYRWSQPAPFQVRAMLLAGDTLFVAGPSDVADLEREHPEGDVWLWAVSAKDGTKKAAYRLPAAPVFDSFAADGQCLYFTTVDGRVVSYQAGG